MNATRRKTISKSLGHWLRDGFEKRGNLLARDAPGIVQAIEVTYTFVDAYQIELGVFVPAVDPSATLREVEDCHIFSVIGAADGTRHIPNTQFEGPLIEAMSDAEMATFATTSTKPGIQYFFSVFASEEECGKLTRSKQVKHMACATVFPI